MVTVEIFYKQTIVLINLLVALYHNIKIGNPYKILVFAHHLEMFMMLPVSATNMVKGNVIYLTLWHGCINCKPKIY